MLPQLRKIRRSRLNLQNLPEKKPTSRVSYRGTNLQAPKRGQTDPECALILIGTPVLALRPRSHVPTSLSSPYLFLPSSLTSSSFPVSAPASQSRCSRSGSPTRLIETFLLTTSIV